MQFHMYVTVANNLRQISNPFSSLPFKSTIYVLCSASTKKSLLYRSMSS